MSLLSKHRSRLWAGVLVLAAALVLAAPSAVMASPAWTARLTVQNHAPITCRNWRLTITAREGAKRLSGSIEDYFFSTGGYGSQQIGADQSAGVPGNENAHFSGGVFHGHAFFPSRSAAGVPIEFNAVVETKLGSQIVSATVTPRAGRRQCG